MVSARDVNASELIKRIAKELEGKMVMPEWAKFVKTGVGRERPPEQANWWFLRAASVLRKVYVDGPVGTSKLRAFYGGLHRRGHKPAHFAKGSGKVIRVILQDLERLGYIEKASKPKRGRVVTKDGQRFLDKIVKECK
jgi:small subunit ribosomal protein S19e